MINCKAYNYNITGDMLKIFPENYSDYKPPKSLKQLVSEVGKVGTPNLTTELIKAHYDILQGVYRTSVNVKEVSLGGVS